MTYTNFIVNNFVIIPNHFFTPEIIEKRATLSSTAQRIGWVGCTINIKNIPTSGKIWIIKNQLEVPSALAVAQYAKSKLIETNNVSSRFWLFDVLRCIERIPVCVKLLQICGISAVLI